MRYVFDHDYHIHSYLSLCSECPEQTPERILQYAKEYRLHTICLTDHYWDRAVTPAKEAEWYQKQDYDHISQYLPLPQDKDVRFLFGCEADMDKCDTIGVPKERYDDFAFIIVPTTHLHACGFSITEDEYFNGCAENRAKLWVSRFDSFLKSDMPFKKVGVAHLATPLIFNRSRKDYLEALTLIPEKEMERLFSKSAELGMGIELNRDDMMFSNEEEETVLRMFKIAKYHGCKFYCASDAHNPKAFALAKDALERAITKLDLKETDKFIIEK